MRQSSAILRTHTGNSLTLNSGKNLVVTSVCFVLIEGNEDEIECGQYVGWCEEGIEPVAGEGNVRIVTIIIDIGLGNC